MLCTIRLNIIIKMIDEVLLGTMVVVNECFVRGLPSLLEKIADEFLVVLIIPFEMFALVNWPDVQTLFVTWPRLKIFTCSIGRTVHR